MRARSIVLLFATVIALSSGSASCKLRRFGSHLGADSGTSGISTATNAVRSKDGKFQLLLPPAWSAAKDLNDQADIQAKGPEGYVIVLSEAKEDIHDARLERYAQGRSEKMSSSL